MIPKKKILNWKKKKILTVYSQGFFPVSTFFPGDFSSQSTSLKLHLISSTSHTPFAAFVVGEKGEKKEKRAMQTDSFLFDCGSKVGREKNFGERIL